MKDNFIIAISENYDMYVLIEEHERIYPFVTVYKGFPSEQYSEIRVDKPQYCGGNWFLNKDELEQFISLIKPRWDLVNKVYREDYVDFSSRFENCYFKMPNYYELQRLKKR